MIKTDNNRIVRTRRLQSPRQLSDAIPLTESTARLVSESRSTIEAIFDGADRRLLVIVGPCSIHDPKAAYDYAQQLTEIAKQVSAHLYVVMRVYFEKPRTVMGWKGLINDPDLDNSYHIAKGLTQARQLLANIAELGLPAGTEFLDTTLANYYSDLISWGAIGARTAESQVHRELASGLSMPVGIKNRTDGNIQVAIDAVRAARHPHLFPGLDKDGTPAILETSGNAYSHLVLRGGQQPNYDRPSIEETMKALKSAKLPEIVMVDCSHANSQKQPARQIDIALDLIKSRATGCSGIRAMMLESFIEGDRQDLSSTPLQYGKSITDACLSLEQTRMLLSDMVDHIVKHKQD